MRCFFAQVVKLKMSSTLLETLFYICAPICTLCAVLYLIWKAAWANVKSPKQVITRGVIDSAEPPRILRSLTVRCAALIYLVAFATALYQFEGAWGTNGILPVGKFVERKARSLNLNEVVKIAEKAVCAYMHVQMDTQSGLGPSPGRGPVRVGAHMGPYGPIWARFCLKIISFAKTS